MLSKRQDLIATLHDRVRKLNMRIRDLEDAERNEVSIPFLRKQVGKCFKYHNSYSCPKDDSERWFIYARILSFDEKNMTFNTIEFEDKHDKKVEIAYERRYNFQGESHFAHGWIPIEQNEYHRARKRLQKFLNFSLGAGRTE